MNNNHKFEDQAVLAKLGATQIIGEEGHEDDIPPTVSRFAETCERVHDDPKGQAIIKDFEERRITAEQFDARIKALFKELE